METKKMFPVRYELVLRYSGILPSVD